MSNYNSNDNIYIKRSEVVSLIKAAIKPPADEIIEKKLTAYNYTIKDFNQEYNKSTKVMRLIPKPEIAEKFKEIYTNADSYTADITFNRGTEANGNKGMNTMYIDSGSGYNLRNKKLYLSENVDNKEGFDGGAHTWYELADGTITKEKGFLRAYEFSYNIDKNEFELGIVFFVEPIAYAEQFDFDDFKRIIEEITQFDFSVMIYE